ncbi:CcdB family protein [Lysobacter soyae]|uniref:Toxin CcdB n=1 Tax=Lysobacter soyae TaxID=2764185 RepID=A0ABX8WPM3_9GAMM|nr:CcdB family protein [Lysobacter sp. CJ11]QYR52654.1 CcdB family protein [Lysobacter sp. CJ11]
MSQFIAYANADTASKRLIPCLLDVQSDLIDTIETRVVIPMIHADHAGGVIDRLMPVVSVADLSSQRGDIMAALDMLVYGI